MLRIFSSFGLLLIVSSLAGGQGLRFARILGDGLVFQQGKPIVTWGWAAPGSKLEVLLTQDPEVGEAAVQAAIKSGTRPAPPAVEKRPERRVRVRYEEENPPLIETQKLEVTADNEGRWQAVFNSAEASFQETWLSATDGEDTIVLENALVGEICVCAGQSNMGWQNFNRKGR